MWRGVLLLGIWLLVGCGDATLLVVDLRTDVRAGMEFTGVRVRIIADGDERMISALADPSADYLAGVRLAEEEGLPMGPLELVVELVDASGATVAERPVRLTLEMQTAVTVVITRNCRGVTCPSTSDPPTALACFAGACVDPECSPETPEACGASECTMDEECAAPVACATARCRDGVCLAAADDALCPGAEVCDLDDGCRLPESPDASTLDSSVDGTADAGVDGGPPDAAGADASDAAPDSATCSEQATQSCGDAPCLCDSGCTCELSCPFASLCTATCSGAGTTCDMTVTSLVSTLSLVCESGAGCTLDVEGIAPANMTCDTGATCDFTCMTDECAVECRGGAACSLRCMGGPSSCAITTCEGTPLSCTGRITTCNAPCP